MGGGDLNSKKSWHPNTIKNQERVWKAEQAAAEENKRIIELQRERAQEMDRAELNEMVKRNASSTNDNRLNWMYDKPDKKVQDEDYLLGKSIEKNYGQSERNEQDVIPAVSRRVVGSSMLTSSGDGQVDLARKIREDPLLLVKERERAARAALLNNPLQRRRLADLLRKEQELRKNKVKKKSKKKGKDLDVELAAKLSALGGENGVDIAKLLDSDSDSLSGSDVKHHKKKKKKKTHKTKQPKKSKKKKHSDSGSDESSSDEKYKQTKSKHFKDTDLKYSAIYKSKSRKRRSETDVSDDDSKKKRGYSSKREPQIHHKSGRAGDSSDDERHKRRRSMPEHHNREESEKKRRAGLSAEERADKLAAMVAAGAAREEQRGRRVEAQRRADAADAADAARAPRPLAGASQARALPDSLETRLHSNRHYIQRDRHHMNENFARRK